MKKMLPVATIGEIITMIGSATRVANAVENGRRPHSRDLQKLGIDPRQFAHIGS